MRNDQQSDAVHGAFDPGRRDRFAAPTATSGTGLQQLLFGAAAGALLALLLAPQAGSDARTWVRDRSRRLQERAGDRLGVVRNALHDGAEVVRQSVAAGRDAYRRARAESRPAIPSEV